MKLPFKILKMLAETALDFVFPRYCLLCGKINPKGEYEHLCPECEVSLRILKGARCTLCSEPIGPESMPNIHGCPKCIDRKFQFDKSFCLCAFDGAAREMVHELKYRTGAHIVRDMAKVAKKFPELADYIRNAVLVPIPLHAAKALKRRYNQSDLIASMLVKTFPESNAKIRKILRRTRKTATQTTLDRESRADNVKDAFALAKAKSAETLPKNTNIVLVDDVMTSGATLSECAKILKKSGFKSVSAFAFARRL